MTNGVNKIDSLVQKLDAVARNHDCVLVVTGENALSIADLTRLEREIGSALPRSLADFLIKRDGMSIQFYRRDEYASKIKFCPRYELNIRSAAEISHLTVGFRDFLDGIGIEPEELRSKAERCIPFADHGESERVIVYSARDETKNGEFLIFDAFNVWGDYLDQLEAKAYIAESFEEYVEKAIQFMLDTEGGFAFWKPPRTELW